MNAEISLKALGKFEDAITKRLDTIMQHIEKLEEKIDTLHEEVQQSHAVASAPLMESKEAKGESRVRKKATFKTMLQ
jgi:prefoldin subunit 5